ncbi:unnamed protein product [Schistosoma curassoni]|uniref:Uncharacterized protein n=1 Tax=Schistosoma curassoni TaxID=6186 RepID=A0A183JCH4_9TREM|nr:unnamed protein product [Schistosoma curassoni]
MTTVSFCKFVSREKSFRLLLSACSETLLELIEVIISVSINGSIK